MNRVTRVPRTPAGPAQSAEPEAASAMPEIPVTPATLLLGIIAVSIVAGYVQSGISWTSQKLAGPVEVSKCFGKPGVNSDKVWPLYNEENQNAHGRIMIAASEGSRTRAEEAAEGCKPDTCSGSELNSYNELVSGYLHDRTRNLWSLQYFYGQPGLERAVEFYNTFADRRLEKSIVAMNARGKLKLTSVGNERESVVAVDILSKWGHEFVVPCPITHRGDNE
jgi:hypothetical protein